ncbi:MAG: NUDIX hydrolase [Bacteroidetes bacterium]|nr:NUDIX hydrolase [Bacteroidota bacterium]
MIKDRKYCAHCGTKVINRNEGDIVRDYCELCDTYFYDNPLPVASTIVVKNREVLLVKRKFDPYKGQWCLPSGFAEIGESIQDAAIRELKEETGIVGKVIDNVNVNSTYNNLYGDLLFITYEAEWIDGQLMAGDDAEEVLFFPLEDFPHLAFDSNTVALKRYIESKKEYWEIVDSFKLSISNNKQNFKSGNFVSDKLIKIIENNADIIARRWLSDVITNNSTPTYATSDSEISLQRNLWVIGQFEKWLGGDYDNEELRKYYRKLGKDRKKEGFALSEILSAISLTRKYIWEFALSQQLWTSTIDIYMTLELERRMMLFFDRASFYAARGFEQK